MRPLLASLWIVALCLSGTAHADEESAVKAIEKLGGRVKRDDMQPGKPVISVDLSFTKLTDEGLKDLKDLQNLTSLYLRFTNVTDEGVKELKDLKNLSTLYLGSTKVTDAGLKELKGLKNLTALNLGDTQVTDAGLKQLREIGLLHALTRATARDGKRPTGPQDVVALDLSGTKVTDKGLKELKGLKNLTALNLGDTQVTDAGLKQLREISLLHALTRATARDGKRPTGPEDVAALDLSGTKVTDEGLKELKGLKNLSALYLGDTQVTNAGVKELKDLTNLTTLYLGSTKVTNEGLKELKDLKNITALYLGDSQVTDAGLKQLREIGLLHALTRATARDGKRPTGPEDVVALDLSGTKVTDEGLKELKDLKNLTTLNLYDTQVTDAGLKNLKTLTSLRLSYAPLVEKYLHDGKFADGEAALLRALEAYPKDDEARFGLGAIQCVRAVENLGRALYKYGAVSEKATQPFLRLPVPKNEQPSVIDYKALGRVLDTFAADLGRAEATLSGIKDDKVKLRLRLAKISFDFAGTGKDRTTLIDLLTKLNAGRLDFQKANPDFRVHFDRGDVAWLRAYCHLLSAMVEGYRAVDEEAGFEERVKEIFPKVEAPEKKADPDWISRLKIVDAPRLGRLRLHLVAVCELNRETWQHIRKETDDDFEWLPHPKQTDQLGLPLTDQRIDAWLAMMEQWEGLLKGERLLPSNLLQFLWGDHPKRKGLNLKKLLDDPPADLFNLERLGKKGIDAKYLEAEEGKKLFDPEAVNAVIQLFNGPLGFAYAARLN